MSTWFLLWDAMHKRGLCRLMYSVETNKHICKFFSPSGFHHSGFSVPNVIIIIIIIIIVGFVSTYKDDQQTLQC